MWLKNKKILKKKIDLFVFKNFFLFVYIDIGFEFCVDFMIENLLL